MTEVTGKEALTIHQLIEAKLSGVYIDGKYAGYFSGNVKVTGGIYGTLYSPSASSNTRSFSMPLSEVDGTSSTTVAEKQPIQ